MNASFGLILRKTTIESLLLPVAPIIRSWGDEEVEVGEKIYNFPLLENIEFQLYPVTPFVKDHLSGQLSVAELEYAWIAGKALDEYEKWIWNNDAATQERHPFEVGCLELIRQADGGAIMLAPEGDRLGEFVSVEPSAAIALLRASVKNLDESKGFLATVNF
jgi:hypothetical protein